MMEPLPLTPSAPTPSATQSPITVEVVGHEVHHEADTSYVRYAVRVTEGADSWLVARRWNELRWLNDDLRLSCKESLGQAPGFRKHRLSSRFSKALLLSREKELEAMLRHYLAVLAVSVVEKRGPLALRYFLSPGELPEMGPETAQVRGGTGCPRLHARRTSLTALPTVPGAGAAASCVPYGRDAARDAALVPRGLALAPSTRGRLRPCGALL